MSELPGQLPLFTFDGIEDELKTPYEDEVCEEHGGKCDPDLCCEAWVIDDPA